ncbi:hypothetical protein [Mariniblastus fucicola]|nr:hypothetical protein [Mariniblastus fucicola]
MPTRILQFQNHWSRMIAATLVACMLLMALEVPIPVRVSKLSSAPFPCQSRPCGCQSADQCWEDCCCFSDAEKLAWASVNHVPPPAWFVRKMEAGNHDLANEKPSCCCSTKNSTESSVSTIEAKTIVRLVSIVRKKKCDGQDQMIQKQACFALVRRNLVQRFESWSLEASPLPFFVAVFLQPPTPPPRTANGC